VAQGKGKGKGKGKDEGKGRHSALFEECAGHHWWHAPN